MPYMQSRGDYLGGGYQRGDPGFFGDLWSGAKALGGALLRRSPVGAVIETVMGPPAMPMPGLPDPSGIGGPAGFQEAIPKPGVRGAVERALPYGESGYVCPTNGANGAPRGKHLNKSGYWTKDGFVAPGTKWVTNRTMNVGNARALRRSIRREQGFVKLAQRSLKGTGYKIARR